MSSTNYYYFNPQLVELIEDKYGNDADNAVSQTDLVAALSTTDFSPDGYFHKIENGVPVQYLLIGSDTSFSMQPIELIHKPAIVITTLTTGSDVINEDILFASDGDYELYVSASYNSDATTSDAIITFSVGGADASTVKDEVLRSEAKEQGAGGGNIAGSGSSQIFPFTRTFYMPGQIAGAKNITLRIESEVGGVEVSMWDVYLTIKRIK